MLCQEEIAAGGSRQDGLGSAWGDSLLTASCLSGNSAKEQSCEVPPTPE